MSITVFPLTYQYDYQETMNFRTAVSDFESGTEQRRARWSEPLRSFKLSFPGLTYGQIETLFNFYTDRQGAYDTFYFDPLHNTAVTNELIGTGNGVKVQFTKTLSSVPIRPTSLVVVSGAISGADNGAEAVTGTGIGGTIDYDTGALDVTFTSAPTTGTQVLASYDPCYKVRFEEDSLSITQFAYRLYSNNLGLKQVRII